MKIFYEHNLQMFPDMRKVHFKFLERKLEKDQEKGTFNF